MSALVGDTSPQTYDVDAETVEKDVDDDVMPVITIEDILNSPFVKTDWMTNMKEMNN